MAQLESDTAQIKRQLMLNELAPFDSKFGVDEGTTVNQRKVKCYKVDEWGSHKG